MIGAIGFSLDRMLAMPCPDVLDQFRLVQHHDKVVSPPALHIEKLVDELESATATLTISWDATRPRKSSLAKPRDGVQRSAKTVRFSSSISVKTIPARKPAQRTSTGLDLVTIMKLTDDELLPLAADSQQPDSPASWRHFGRIGWSIERHPSAVLALNVPKPSKMSSEHRSHHYRRGTSKQKGVSPYCCPAFALEYIIATDSGSQHLPERGFSIQRNRGFLSTVHRLTSVYRQSSALGLLHKTNSSNSTLRYRLALSRHTRQLRQRDTARIRGTPLRRRRCQLSTMLRMRRVDKVSRDVHKTKTVVSPSILLHIPSTTRPTSEFEAFVSQRILSTHEQRSDSQALSYNSQPASRTVGNSTSRQLKTYVDHIRNQRGPPKKALDAHHISRSL